MGYGVTPTNVEFGYAFSIEEYQQRLKALFGQMREAGVDRLCLESGGNWFWRLSERAEFCGGQAARSRVSSAIS